MYRGKLKQKAILTVAIVLFVLIVAFVIYFIATWCSLGAVEVPLEDIIASSYSNLDSTIKLRFVSDKYVVFEVKEERFVFDYETLKYIDGMIILDYKDKQFYFATLSENRLYNNEFNVMLYPY